MNTHTIKTDGAAADGKGERTYKEKRWKVVWVPDGIQVKKCRAKNCNKNAPIPVDSVGDPKPDTHVFGPPGSGSVSQRYGSGSFHFLIRCCSD